MTLLASFKVGNVIEIQETENVTHRFPHLIGQIAVIITAPNHPSTWYTVRVMQNDTVVKLQPTAMKLAKEGKYDKDSIKFLDSQQSTQEDSVKSSQLESPLGGNRSRSNSYVSSVSDLQENTKVVVLKTENVLNRLPHLVGCVGTIISAPVHPATWYKVEFENGQVATFRPSALKSVNEITSSVSGLSQKVSDVAVSTYIDDPEEDMIGRPIEAQKVSNQDNAELDMQQPSNAGASKRSRSRKPQLLSLLDPDLWVGSTVRVIGGRFNDHEGRIVKSGNGWVQVFTSNGEELSKRAHELEVVIAATRPADEGKDRDRDREEGVRLDHIPSRERKRDATAMGQSSTSRKSSRLENSNENDDFNGKHKHSADYDGNPYNNSSKSDGGIILLPPHIRNAQKVKMQKLVEKQQERLGDRPNIAAWKRKLRCNFLDIEIEEDYLSPTYFPADGEEKVSDEIHVMDGRISDRIARELIPTCPRCRVEYWPASEYCWNRYCPRSTLFDPDQATGDMTRSSTSQCRLRATMVSSYLWLAPSIVLSANTANGSNVDPCKDKEVCQEK